MNKTNEFLNLVKLNPDLPIIPMVNADVVGDDYGNWIGEWGRAEVKKYYMGREKVHFLDEDDEEDVLSDLAGFKYCTYPEGRDIYDLPDDEWEKLYKSIPWADAIVVYIEPL